MFRDPTPNASYITYTILNCLTIHYPIDVEYSIYGRTGAAAGARPAACRSFSADPVNERCGRYEPMERDAQEEKVLGSAEFQPLFA